MEIKHDFFKFYLCKVFTYELNRCNENCNKIQTSEHLLSNCHHYFDEQKQLKNNMKISVSLRTLFNTSESIKNVLNLIKSIRNYTKK